MRIPGKKTLARLVRPLSSTWRPGGLVLGYHRIAEEPWDPLGLCVRPSHFRQQIEILCELYSAVPMRRLVETLMLGEDVKDLVALTFDDGYRDFIDNALTELERFGIPVTVFVATGFLNKAYWWDEVVAALDPGKCRSPRLTLHWGDISGERVYTGLDTSTGATRAVRDLCRELSSCSASLRAQVVQQLREIRQSQSNPGVSSRPMSTTEIRRLARCPAVEVGSHTVSHAQLTLLAEQEQAREIEESKQALEALIDGDAICAFSYPHGSVPKHAKRLLEAAGFRYACTSREALVRHDSDVFALPRVWARDVGGSKFRTWASSWRGIRLGA